MLPDDKADRHLQQRLLAAGVTTSEDEPLAAWKKLRQSEGNRATILDLYRIVAVRRGVQPQELPPSERLALAHAALPSIWPGFEVTEGSNRDDPMELAEYDSAWQDTFRRWRLLIARALGSVVRRIDHIGSTSVPGLLAKPTVDIQVSVSDVSDEDAYVPALATIGLQLRSRDDLHRYFRPFAGQPREVHVHVCAAGSAWEREHLLFRDYLRAHPEARDAYADAKREALEVWSDDRLAYTEAKAEVILAILDAAQRDNGDECG